jgi:DNA gyrase subunit A
MVYQMKVYRLPLGTPQARGKAMVNLLPLSEGEWIQTVMPMPLEEETWENLQVMFATSAGTVRRNDLSDFTNIKKNGKIAMKLDDGERLISVQPCSEEHDVLLTTKAGKAIRFQVSDVRVFKSRGSMGVRGIKLVGRDAVVGMSILRHVNYEGVPNTDLHEREVYLRQTSYLRRVTNETIENETDQPEVMLSPERLAFLGAAEDFILTVTENGIGKRTSAYEYRITNRGGQGIWNIDVTDRAGSVVAGFPVNHSDQIMLVTNSGQLIRCAVDEIGITGRRTQGVWIFRVDNDERVVSVSLIGDEVNSSDEQDDTEGPPEL